MTSKINSKLSERIFAGNSEMARLMRSHPWSQLPLGAVATWPQSLKTALSILLNASCPMFLVWGSDRVLFYNDTYASLLKARRLTAALGRPIDPHWQEDWHPLGLDIEQVFRTGQPWQCEPEPDLEKHNACHQGAYRWSYSAIWQEADEVGGVVVSGCADDIQTGLSNPPEPIQEALQRREEQLHLIINAVPALIAYVDKDHYYRFTNQTYKAWFGQSAADFMDQPVREVLGEAAYESILPYMEQALAGQPVSFERQIFYRDGGTRYIQADYVPHINSQGEVEGLFGLVSDISDRKQAEAALRQSEEWARLAVKVGRLGTWRYHLSTDLVELDPRMREMWGEPPDAQLIPLPRVMARIHPEDRDRVAIAIEAALDPQSPGLYEIDYRIVWDDGTERWICANGQVQFEGEGESRQPIGFVGTALDISDRKSVEAALRESEARFRQMTDAAPMLVWMSGTDKLCHYFNQPWLNFTGRTMAQELGNGWAEGVHPDDFQYCVDTYATAFDAHQPFEMEYRLRRFDGEYRWLLDVGVPRFAPEGEFLGYIGSCFDVHDRKRQEEAQKYLAEVSKVLVSSLDYQTTLNQLAQQMVPYLADWCIVHVVEAEGSIRPVATAHVNPAKVKWADEIRKRYPLQPDEPRGTAQVLRTGQSELYSHIPDALLVEAARDPEHLRLLREVGFHSVMIVPMQARGKTLGTLTLVAAESQRCYDSADLTFAEELARHAALAVDNAQLYYKAQQAQQIAEQFANRTVVLQQVTAALSQALTPQQVADVVMEQGIAAMGASAGSIALLVDQGTTLKVLRAVGYPESMLSQWYSFPVSAAVPLAETVRTGEPLFLESEQIFVAAYPHLASSIAVTGNRAFACLPLAAEGQMIGVMGLSFAESQAFHPEARAFMLTLSQQCAQAIARAHLYEAEQTARNAAEAANRIKDEFLAVLSHELRSPLNPILGWSRLLQTGKLDESRAQQALETIERNAKLQAKLVEDLLDVSRILRGKLSLTASPVDLAFVISEAIETVRLAAEAKSIQIEVRLDANVGKVLGDSTRLQQVVWNLLSNAVKFTPVGGRVEVRLERVNQHAQITVCDTGKGFSPSFLPYVFDYFRQADSSTTRKFGGLGLGLAIVRHLVELHGGTIQADSLGEGLGATFIVKLPLMPTQPSVNSVTEGALSSLDLRGTQILVVDDEPDTRDLVAFLLEQAGARVSTFASAKEAFAALVQFQPDVLLSDIGMPEMDGYMLLRQVRALPPEQGGNIPAIALTAYAGEYDQQQALAAGFQQHVPKPVEPGVLIRAIAALVNKS